MTWPIDGIADETRLLCFACLYPYGGQLERSRPLHPGAETIPCYKGEDHEADVFLLEDSNLMALWVCWEHLRSLHGRIHFVGGHRCSSQEEVDALVAALSPYPRSRTR